MAQPAGPSVVAATRLPDVPLHDGTARPDGTVLLLHATVMADSDADAHALLAPLQHGPLAGRALGHVQDRTSVIEENAAQTAQNPEGYRYAVDCTWTTGQPRPRPKKVGPGAVREFIAEQAAIGFDSVKLLMSNDDVFTEGGSMITQYSPGPRHLLRPGRRPRVRLGRFGRRPPRAPGRAAP